MSTAESANQQLTVSYQDDPKVLEEAAVSDYADHVVPLSGRMSRWSLTMAWYGVASALFYVVTGSAVALTYGTKSALVGLILTIIVYSIINAVLTKEAAATGLSVAMFSRSMFGLAGAALATLIFAATALYYFVFEGSIIALAFQVHFGGNDKLWAAAVCVAGLLLVMRGVAQWLDKLNGFLLPFYLVGMIVAVGTAISKYEYTSAWWTVEGSVDGGLPGWLGAFIIYMGVWVLMMFTMDFARLGKPEDTKYHQVVTFGPVFYALAFGFSAFVGVFLVTTVPTDPNLGGEAGAAVAIVQLMGFLGVLLVFVTQARINTANLYLASSNLEAFMARAVGLRLPRTVWTVVCAVICWVLMVSGDFLAHVGTALLYQGVFITSWVAMALVHIAYVRSTGTKVEVRPWRVPAVNPGGLAAWLISVVIGIMLIELPAEGSNVTALAPVITVILAAGLYGGSLAIVKPATREGGADPATEVDDAWAARILCEGCQKSYVAVEMDRRPGTGQVMCASCAQVNAAR